MDEDKPKLKKIADNVGRYIPKADVAIFKPGHEKRYSADVIFLATPNETQHELAGKTDRFNGKTVVVISHQ